MVGIKIVLMRIFKYKKLNYNEDHIYDSVNKIKTHPNE